MVSRREVLQSSVAAVAFGTGRRLLAAAATEDGAHPVTPLRRQIVWQDCEVGAIFHFDMPLFGTSAWSGHAAIHQTWDPKAYNPAQLDTDQWIAAAKAMGARYAIITATHFNGFLQWQSDLYPYGVKQASWRGGQGDLVGDFVESCRKADLKPGIYMSCFRNAWWKVDRYRVNYGQGGEQQAEFAKTCEKMFEELCTRYGPLVQIWFDAGNIHPDDGGPDLLPIADKHQPEMVFYHSPERREHRWIGNESGYAGYPCWSTMPDLRAAEQAHKGRGGDWRELLLHGDPAGQLWSPGMVDTVLRNHHWFWKPNTEQTIEPLERLVKFYYESVGRNSNLVLGLTPDPTGLLPAADVERCAELGKEIRRRFERPVAQTKGHGQEIELKLPKPQKINHVVMMEEIAHGERVREYVVEGQVPGNSWRELCRGISIGHKRIQQSEPQEVAAVRLRVTRSDATPRFRDLSVYFVD
jgi:alpha-L-fucosidase